MKNVLTAAELTDMFLYAAGKIVESKDYLTAIDSKIGDGDHGIGMAQGFSAVCDELSVYKNPESVEDVFYKVGDTLLDNMGGASGVLFATIFISGIADRDKHICISTEDFSLIFRKSLNALKKRGKAQRGDKTMVDALEPAVLALEDSASKHLSLIEAFKSAAEEARCGMEETKNIRAKLGRARFYGDKSLGLQDPGACSVWILFQAMSDWMVRNA